MGSQRVGHDWVDFHFTSKFQIPVLINSRDLPLEIYWTNTFIYLFNTNTHMCVLASFLQSCPTPYDPMDCSLPGSSVHRILWARILEWVAVPSSRESSQPRDRNCVSYVSCIGSQVLYTGALWEAQYSHQCSKNTHIYIFTKVCIKDIHCSNSGIITNGSKYLLISVLYIHIVEHYTIQ